MKKLSSMFWMFGIASVAAVAMAAACADAPSAGAEQTAEVTGRGGAGNTVLYVWAQDAAHLLPDFVAVVGFQPGTGNYGKILSIAQIPAPNASGNEPHHVGLSPDGNHLGLGGLLSLLKGQAQVFFFDVSSPFNPVFQSAVNPTQSAITDEFVPLQTTGGFFVTMMGAADGTNPGRVDEYDSHQHLIGEWPVGTLPTDGSFNPHGITVNEGANIMLTSDFICPAHTLNIPGGDMADFRDTIRVWDLAGRAITGTIHAGTGMMEIKFIPGNMANKAYAPGYGDGNLWLINPGQLSATAVFNFSTAFPVPGTGGAFPSLTSMTPDGRNLFVSLEYFGAAGKIVMMNIENPNHPTVVQAIDLGANSGPHYVRLTNEQSQRLIVTDYFLVEDLAPGGVVQADGDHKVHVFNVARNSFSEDTSFGPLDLNNAMKAFGYNNGVRPHGAVAK
jgi:selenium-binding protein 1